MGNPMENYWLRSTLGCCDFSRNIGKTNFKHLRPAWEEQHLMGPLWALGEEAVSYTHLTLPTISLVCRSRWSPYH